MFRAKTAARTVPTLKQAIFLTGWSGLFCRDILAFALRKPSNLHRNGERGSPASERPLNNARRLPLIKKQGRHIHTVRADPSFARRSTLLNGHAIRAPFKRSNPQKKGHTRMVDDLRFKVDRFAISDVMRRAAGIPPPKARARQVRAPIVQMKRFGCGAVAAPLGLN
ncbi:MAG: hypothetical protein CBHOC_2147 [uncultured Caballeronia sp.]|nr:MAG: hypothetical protein CBHOC_2147 [uncultured Caballeronia sp.]